MVLPESATYTPARTSGAAITAIVLAIASFLLLPLLPAIGALFVASGARKTIAASGGTVQGANLCQIATIIAWVNIGLVAAAALVLLPVGPGSAVSTTFRLSLRQRLPVILGMLIILTANRRLNVLALVILAGVATVSIRAAGRYGVTLTAEGAWAEGIRSRCIPWSAVREITSERMLGTRFVVLRTDRGKTRLRAPITGFLQHDADFDEKYAEVVSCWRTYRGAE